MTEKLQDNESILSGQWGYKDGAVIQDADCKRIEWLTNSFLQLVGVSGENWAALYLNPEDGSYWLLTYPNSDWHGGGPPQLKRVPKKDDLNDYPDLSKLWDT